MTEQDIRSLLHEIAAYCDIQEEFMQEIMDNGLVAFEENSTVIRHDTLERLLRIKRLHDHLGVNLEGIAVIMHMRERIEALQEQMKYLMHRDPDDSVERIFIA